MPRTTTESTNGRNGNQPPILDKDLITDLKDLEARTNDVTTSSSFERDSQVVKPEVAVEKEVVATPVAPTPKKSKKNLILAGLGIGAIVAGGFGYKYWQFASTHQTTDDATVVGHIHQVSSKVAGTVGEVLVNDNQQVKEGDLLVKLDPKDYQNKVQQAVAALQSAQQQANAAQANIGLASQTTTGKTTQAQGDVSTAQASVSTARAAVQEAEVGIPAAEAAVQEAEAGIPAAESQVAQADATLTRTQADYKRYENLFRQGAIARQQLDTARAAYDVALAQRNGAIQGVQQAQARLASAKVGVARAQSLLAQAQEGVTTAQAKLAAARGGLQQATASGQQTSVNRSQYAAAQGAIAQSQAALKDAQLQLSYTSIFAPAAGRVGRKTVEVGNRIQSAAPLMAIVNNDYWVVANFKETQLEKMHPGQVVDVKLDAFPSHTFIGRVDSVSPASGAQFALLPPDNATGNFTKVVQRIPVKIVIEPKSMQGYDSRITPGMSAEVTVEVK